MECRESRRAEAPCASVSSEATLGSKREQREPTCSCAILPHSGPRASSVLVPSGPRCVVGDAIKDSVQFGLSVLQSPLQLRGRPLIPFGERIS